jgi:hypothetical protein
MSSSERLQLADREFTKPARALGKRFVQRWDLQSRQLEDGRYVCIHKPLHIGHLMAHLKGEITLGSYVLDENSKSRFVVFDADDHPGFANLIRLSESLSSKDIPSYLETSRRGGHLWLFFDQVVPGHLVRSFGKGLLKAHNIEEMEIFPRQDQLLTGPGSLIRMPFGIHKLSSKRYPFIHPNGERLAPTVREQIAILSIPEFVSDAAFKSYLSNGPSLPPMTRQNAPGESRDTLSARIKSRVTVLEFVSQYVNLKPTGSGAVGLCPFHNDQHASFGVNDEGNYWHCFSGCGGGSVIDFYMLWRDCDFTEAVTELAYWLL